MSHAVKDNRGKWAPNYEGPFVVKKAFFRRGPGAYQHGWRGAAFTCEFRCCQAILYLEAGAIEDIAACSFIFCVFFLVSPKDSSLLYISHHSLLKEENMGLRLQSSLCALNHVQFVIT